MRPRPQFLVERALVAALVLYAGRLAADTVGPVARPAARLLAGQGCADAERRVAATERAFAATARAGGPAVRAAFLAFIADSGAVLAGPGLVRRAQLEASPPRPGHLYWRPEFVFASAAGDLGFSTGPAESHPGDAGGPVGHSHYSTVWALQPDGSYRFLADIGTSHDAPGAGMARATDPVDPAPPSTAPLDCPAAPEVAPASAVAAARAADSAYAAAVARSWREGARLHAADVRLHRGGRHPLVGRAVADSVAAWDVPFATRARHTAVARSGDFAWTRGTYALGPAAAPTETGAFLRVWRRQPDGSWKLAVEIVSPGGPPRRADS